MLIFTRKYLESVIVGAPNNLDALLKITALEINGNSVKLGFDVNRDVQVNRWEVWRRTRAGMPHKGQRIRRPPIADH